MPHYIYLHGFASSPQSVKAKQFQNYFAQLNQTLHTPDLNQGDFTHLTLTRQIKQIEAELPIVSTPVTLIGSSFGGLTAAWLGQIHHQVERLVLLAPAFSFLSHWLPRLGKEELQQWRDQGFLAVYHHGEKEIRPLSYQFAEDAAQYREIEIQRPVPTLIIHGQKDEIIPIESSIDFASKRPWVELIQVESDHGLTDVSSHIWQLIRQFCKL